MLSPEKMPEHLLDSIFYQAAEWGGGVVIKLVASMVTYIWIGRFCGKLVSFFSLVIKENDNSVHSADC